MISSTPDQYSSFGLDMSSSSNADPRAPASNRNQVIRLVWIVLKPCDLRMSMYRFASSTVNFDSSVHEVSAVYRNGRSAWSTRYRPVPPISRGNTSSLPASSSLSADLVKAKMAPPINARTSTATSAVRRGIRSLVATTSSDLEVRHPDPAC